MRIDLNKDKLSEYFRSLVTVSEDGTKISLGSHHYIKTDTKDHQGNIIWTNYYDGRGNRGPVSGETVDEEHLIGCLVSHQISFIERNVERLNSAAQGLPANAFKIS